MKTAVGIVTIGQAPRVDVVPEMAELMGPGVRIVERGALDGLARPQIDRLAPGAGDDILVTRLATGESVFVAKRHITPLMQRRLEELEADGVDVCIVLCTGHFDGLHTRRPLVEPDAILRGVLGGVRCEGRLGIVTPSTRHVAQTDARWRAYGFEPVVAALSPYDEGAGAGIEALVAPLRQGGAGLVVLDCMGFRRQAREDLRAALGVPVIVANLLVARVVAELAGSIDG